MDVCPARVDDFLCLNLSYVDPSSYTYPSDRLLYARPHNHPISSAPQTNLPSTPSILALLCSTLPPALQIPSSAPLLSSLNLTLQSLCSPKHHISPFLPKQKFAHPPSICTFPINIPPLFHTLIPSPHPEYTFPNTSHLIPSGAPVSAYANTLLLVR